MNSAQKVELPTYGGNEKWKFALFPPRSWDVNIYLRHSRNSRDLTGPSGRLMRLATRLKKTRHKRGSRTCGWGTSGQHRGSGSRGGSGIAGRYRHKRSRLIRTGEFANMHYEGKKGFTPVSPVKDEGRTLNIIQLSELVDRLTLQSKAEMAGEKIVVDLKQLGFRKLLGAGSITRPVQVRIDECSEAAAKKLKEAGGELVNTVPPK